MKKLQKVIILLLIFTIIPSIGFSKPSTNESSTITGYHIYQGCRYYFTKRFSTKENIAKKNACNGYFFGVGSTLLILIKKGIGLGICIPNDISTEQVIKDYLNWAKYHLQYIKVAFATDSVMLALKKKYPCIKK